MIINNKFFVKKKNIYLSDILQILKINDIKDNLKINNILDLDKASKNDISFFNSLRYLDLLSKSNVKYVITSEKYSKIVKNYCKPIIVKNVLKSVALITKLFYPNSLDDAVDFSLKQPIESNYKKIKFGKNILIGKNVKIGRNTIIGHNSIVESNVVIGLDCVIGNNVIIKNSIIGNNVRILDGAIIGKKGFGFLPDKKKKFQISSCWYGNNSR